MSGPPALDSVLLLVDLARDQLGWGRVSGMDVAEIGREGVHPRLDVEARPVPAEQGADRKAVAFIPRAG